MAEQQSTPASAQQWADELKRYHEAYKTKFDARGDAVIKRYRDERTEGDTSSRFNILWSNVRILKPALYAKIPKPQVSRRYKDKNPVSRCAAQMLERALTYEITQFQDYKSSLSNVVDDRLLPGRGTAWIRYEPVTEPVEPVMITEDAESEEPMERLTAETTPVDYVYWKDFAHDPARTWEEVTWCARRVYLGKDEVIERFGEEFRDVPLVNQPEDENKTNEQKQAIAKAEIWEIWDKPSKRVYWIAQGYPTVLDEQEPPLTFDTFFPCPKPLYATITTGSLVPVADYVMYQDQAKELDEVTGRITKLTKSLKAMGVYAADEPALLRLLKEGTDSDMLPVINYQAFAEKGGLKGSYDMLDLSSIVMALKELYVNREAIKQTIYEITGISDILRGATNAAETASAQNIKAQYASVRLSEMKNDVARFACDLIRLKAQVICDKYQPETLVSMSGMQDTPDAEFIGPAIEMLKNDVLRDFHIDIESDSLIEADEQQEKQDRLEFLTATSDFIAKVESAVQASPTLAPLAGQLLLFAVRSFKVGESIEAEFESFIEQMQTAAQQPKPDPEAQKIQAEQQHKQMEMQADMQLEQIKLQYQQQCDSEKLRAEMQLEQMKMDFERWKVELQESTKIEIAKVNAQSVKQDIKTLEQP